MSVRLNNREFSRNKFCEEKPKKFCGVCQKAGLSEREYTSHFTKSVPGSQGIVTCPTILNNECGICFQLGHFKSACPEIARKNRINKEESSVNKYNKKESIKEIPKQSVTNRGGFAALEDSDDENESKTLKRTFSVANKGPTPVVSIKAIDPSVPSFASIVARAPVKKVEPVVKLTGFTVITNTGSTYIPKEEPKKRITKIQDWLAESSDEEDDDEDNTAW
jgi:hypothetical protein